MSNGVEIGEFRAAYRAEVAELLDASVQRLLALETLARKGAGDPRSVRELFRALHTVKGLSAMVGIEPVVNVAHRMEAALRTADRAGTALSAAAVDVLLQGLRAIEQQLAALDRDSEVEPAPAALLEALDALESGESVPPAAPSEPVATAVAAPASTAPATAAIELDPALFAKLAVFEREQLAAAGAQGKRAVRADFVPSAERAARNVTINSVRERLGAIAEIVKVLPVSRPATKNTPGGLSFAMLLVTTATDAEIDAAVATDDANVTGLIVPGAIAPAAVPAPPAPPTPPAPAPAPLVSTPDLFAPEPIDDATGSQVRGVVRVEVARLDDAMDRLSQLIVSRHRLARAVATMRANGADTREVDRVLVETARELRELRASIVRVRMVALTEVLERVPLLVRGLRRSTGKQVRLDLDVGRAELDKSVAERLFPAVVHLVRNAMDHAIEMPDVRVARGKSGEGTLRIAARARSDSRLELVVQDDGAGIDVERLAKRANRPVPATMNGLVDLLCVPGLSSRDQANETSGRGMGMDIVRRTVSELGGDLEVHTERGAGTSFVLHVPLTVTIIDALAFECGAQRFVVPLATVDEIVEVEMSRVVEVPRGPNGTGHGALIERRGETLPLLSLARLLSLGGAHEGVHSSRALVVRRGGEPVAFGIDKLVGQQEVVVRPLHDPLAKVPGVVGATDLGDGRPTLVLDLVALGALGTRDEGHVRERERESREPGTNPLRRSA